MMAWSSATKRALRLIGRASTNVTSKGQQGLTKVPKAYRRSPVLGGDIRSYLSYSSSVDRARHVVELAYTPLKPPTSFSGATWRWIMNSTNKEGMTRIAAMALVTSRYPSPMAR